MYYIYSYILYIIDSLLFIYYVFISYLLVIYDVYLLLLCLFIILFVIIYVLLLLLLLLLSLFQISAGDAAYGERRRYSIIEYHILNLLLIQHISRLTLSSCICMCVYIYTYI